MAKIPDKIVKKSLPKLFDSYPHINSSSPSAWISWKKDGEVIKEHFGEICHANMKYAGTGWDELITAVPYTSDINLAYQRMLIHGPFKSVADLISLEHLDKNYFFHCSGLEKWPANLIYNFCVATRVPIEHGALLPVWFDLVEKGYDPVLAFLLSYSTDGEANGSREFPNNNHFWIDSSSDWSRIIKGEPTNLSEFYREKPSACAPCNIIWGISQDYLKIKSLSNEEVSEFYGLPIEIVKEPPPVKAMKLNKIQDIYDANMQALNAAAPAAAMWEPGFIGGGGAGGPVPVNFNNWAPLPEHQIQPQPEIGPNDIFNEQDEIDDEINFDDDPDFD